MQGFGVENLIALGILIAWISSAYIQTRDDRLLRDSEDGDS